MTAAAALSLFPALMAFAAFSDLLTMTIPNRVSLALVAAFVALAVIAGAPLGDILAHVSCAAATLVATFAMFHLRWMGGGDAKLAAATALWLGWELLADYALVAGLAGGALTLAILELRRLEPRFIANSSSLAHLCDKTAGVPYGIALAIAGLLVYPQSALWASLLRA